MAREMQVVFFDPQSNTRVVYDMKGELHFGILLKTALGDLINKISKNTGVPVFKIMTDVDRNSRFVIRVEPKGSPR